MRNGRRGCCGVVASCFGAGLIVSSILPAKAVILLLAIAVVCLGINCSKF